MSRIEEEEEEDEEMLYGGLLEHCLSIVRECPECNEGLWIPVGFFTTKAKYEEWKVICGYEQLPPEYRITEVPIDEGPISITSTRDSPDTGISLTTNDENKNWLPRGEEK